MASPRTFWFRASNGGNQSAADIGLNFGIEGREWCFNMTPEMRDDYSMRFVGAAPKEILRHNDDRFAFGERQRAMEVVRARISQWVGFNVTLSSTPSRSPQTPWSAAIPKLRRLAIEFVFTYSMREPSRVSWQVVFPGEDRRIDLVLGSEVISAADPLSAPAVVSASDGGADTAESDPESLMGDDGQASADEGAAEGLPEGGDDDAFQDSRGPLPQQGSPSVQSMDVEEDALLDAELGEARSDAEWYAHAIGSWGSRDGLLGEHFTQRFHLHGSPSGA